jgi:transposase
MAGTFEGLSDSEWRLLADLFPPEPMKRSRGMPHTPFCKIVNTLLSVLITGCRWCDLPRGSQRASKSAAHRWLRRWRDDGTLAAMQARLLGLAEERGMIQWHSGALDASFPAGKGGDEGVAHGRKSKGILSTVSPAVLACRCPCARRPRIATSGPKSSHRWMASASVRANRIDRANGSGKKLSQSNDGP